MLKKLFVSIAILASLSSQAQYSYRLAGDRFYLKGDYISAAYYYAKYFNGEIPSKKYSPYNVQKQGARIIDNTTVPSETAFRLGDSYYRLDEYTKAEPLFKALVAEHPDEYPQSRVLYAVCLRARGDWQDALYQLDVFIQQNPRMEHYTELAQRELDICFFIHRQLNSHTTLTLRKIDSTLANEEFAPEGNRKYLTKTFQYDDGTKTAAIYMSEKTGNKWSAPVLLLGGDTSNYGMPHVTGDGKYLLLASDRRGTMGGYDIWYTELNDKGRPTELQNMGSGINTKTDDTAPFYHTNTGSLVFASKGRIGMGGFDLFAATGQIGGQFTDAKNLGHPVNSVKDDVSFIGRGAGLLDGALISSSRESNCCLETYSIQKTNESRVALGNK